MSVTLAGETFSSWNRVRQHHLAMMRRHRAAAEPKGRPFQSIVRATHPDYAFLDALFRRHADRAYKLKGSPVHYFEFAPDNGDTRKTSKNWCCFVINKNGRRVRWSAKHIGATRQKKKEDKRKMIFRVEISGQRDRFAYGHPEIVPCDECGTDLRNTKARVKVRSSSKKRLPSANVDHDVQKGQAFIETFEAFQEKMGDRKLSFTWTKRYNRNIQVLADRNLAKQWRLYHKQKTVFRFLCTTCNNQSHNKAKRRKK